MSEFKKQFPKPEKRKCETESGYRYRLDQWHYMRTGALWMAKWVVNNNYIDEADIYKVLDEEIEELEKETK